MNQTAANLIDRVLPVVPVRQWVISFPMPLRFWLARRPALRKVVLGIFVRVVFSWARRQARVRYREPGRTNTSSRLAWGWSELAAGDLPYPRSASGTPSWMAMVALCSFSP